MFLVFWQFFKLGLISFGGPAAHLGIFQKQFVQQLKWLSQSDYGRLVALCQFLPGPASSQVGFAIGVERAGVMGGIAAFLGFTLPSFVIMVSIALLAQQLFAVSWFEGLVQGLKLAAVVIVTDAVITMYRSFCHQVLHQAIALCAAAIIVTVPSVASQMLVITIAAILGIAVSQPKQTAAPTKTRPMRLGWIAASIFIVLFGLSLLPQMSMPLLDLFRQFFQAGSLVFGGGHVVLPLLQQSVATSLENDVFLLGYASAQAIPGPLFTLSSYLGAAMGGDNAWLWAGVATLAIFLPGFLLVLALQQSWMQLTQQPKLLAAVAAVNAAVVGLLIAALYSPVFVTTVRQPIDLSLVLFAIVFLRVVKAPTIAVVCGLAIIGMLL